MEFYDETLRTLRQDKGFTLKSLSEDIVSYSYLSKFEKGLSDITLINITELLSRLNVTLDEFMYFNKAQIPQYFNLLGKIAIAYSENDMDKLLEYFYEEQDTYEKTNSVFSRCNYIMIGAIIQDIDPDFVISKDDVDFYIDYIFNCTYWSTYEISLFGNALHLFTEESLHLLLEEVKKKLDELKVAQMNVRDVLSLLQNATIILLRNGSTEEALELSRFIGTHLKPNDYFERNRKKFIEGLIEITQGNVTKGKETAEKAISVVEFVSDGSADAYKKELEKTLDNVKSE